LNTPLCCSEACISKDFEVVGQNTKTELYPLRDAQPVEIAQERRDVFRTPCEENEACGGVEDGLKSVQKVTRDADQQ